MATTRSELHDQPQIADMFGAALGRSEHGVIVLDSEGCVAFWNNWVAQASGIPADAAMRRNLSDVFDEVLPQRLLNAVGQALKGRQAATLSRALNPRLFPPVSRSR
jgi:PAS domain-containing protein